MDRGGLEEVGAAHDLLDLLRGVVHDDRHVVGRADVAPGEHDVAHAAHQRLGRHGVVPGRDRAGVAEPQGTGPSHGAGHVEADGVVGLRLGHGAAAACAGVDQPVGAVHRRALLWRRERRADVGAAAAAGVGEAHGREAPDGVGVERQALGLAEHRPGPGEAEPGQVLLDQGLPFGAGAGRVDVLDAQEEAPEPAALPRGERGVRVAEVERPRGRGREARPHRLRTITEAPRPMPGTCSPCSRKSSVARSGAQRSSARCASGSASAWSLSE